MAVLLSLLVEDAEISTLTLGKRFWGLVRYGWRRRGEVVDSSWGFIAPKPGWLRYKGWGASLFSQLRAEQSQASLPIGTRLGRESRRV